MYLCIDMQDINALFICNLNTTSIPKLYKKNSKLSKC